MTKKGCLLGALLLSLSLAVAAADPPKPTSASTSREAAAKEKGSAKVGAASIEMLRKSAAKTVKVQPTQCTAAAGGHCVVTLAVNANCRLEPSDPELIIPQGVKVYLTITTPGWKFDPANGLKFKNPKAPFSSALHNDTTWVVEPAANTAGQGRFPYALKVTKGAEACESDPGYWL